MINNEHVLIIGNIDYADELSCEFFNVWPKIVWDDLNAGLKKYFPKDNEFNFGDNQVIKFNDYDEFERQITVKEISDKEIEVFNKFFSDKYKTSLNEFYVWFGTAGYLLDNLQEDLNDQE